MSHRRHGAFSYNYAVIRHVSRSFALRELSRDIQKLDPSQEDNQNQEQSDPSQEDNQIQEKSDPSQEDDQNREEAEPRPEPDTSEEKVEDNDDDVQKEDTNKEQSIDYDRARVEQQGFIEALRKCSVKVVELHEDEDYKDSCCVEDCAVVIGSTALITSPGPASRRGETKTIRLVLENDLKLDVKEISDGSARLDGGDVLFTGKEILVGVGKNTNEQGAQAVAQTFLDYVVVPIWIDKLSCVHLKSVCSMVGNQVIAISSSPDGDKLCKKIQENAQFSYALLKMDSDEAANMIFVNGYLIHRTREEIGDTSYSILDEKVDPHVRHEVCIRELSRARVTLSSLVLLVNKQKNARKLISNLQDGDLDKYASTEFIKKSVT